jgi:hypothetical protein
VGAIILSAEAITAIETSILISKSTFTNLLYIVSLCILGVELVISFKDILDNSGLVVNSENFRIDGNINLGVTDFKLNE